MVTKYESCVRRVDADDDEKERLMGSVQVLLDAPVDVTGYDGTITDEDVEQAAIEAIQEGKARVIRIDAVD